MLDVLFPPAGLWTDFLLTSLDSDLRHRRKAVRGQRSGFFVNTDYKEDQHPFSGRPPSSGLLQAPPGSVLFVRLTWSEGVSGSNRSLCLRTDTCLTNLSADELLALRCSAIVC